jgi:hypothetical protein
LLLFFANALPVTKAAADNDDTSVNTRNTKIIFLTCFKS